MLMEIALDNTIEKLKLVVEKMKVVGDGECWTVEEHEQIVKWLEELKELRMSAEKILSDYERDYNKAIEDMVSSLIRNSSTEAINGNVTLVVTDKRIKFIAEQLKKGDAEQCNKYEKDNRWIPCSERLPEAAGREVLATLENKYGQRRCAIVFQGYGDNRWHCNHKEYNLDYWKATAWQPVPEPYKED